MVNIKINFLKIRSVLNVFIFILFVMYFVFFCYVFSYSDIFILRCVFILIKLSRNIIFKGFLTVF